MIFSYDKYNRLDKPSVYLAKPSKNYIGTLQTSELVTDLCFNDISQVKFKVLKYNDKEYTIHYDDIEMLRLVEIQYIGWFQIVDVNTVGDSENEYKEITALSLENELTTKNLTCFGSLGSTSTDITEMPKYKLYDISNPEHSIMHIIVKKVPSWKVGYIDPAIGSTAYSFTNDSIGVYSFLVGDVSSAYDCIFQFDTYSKSISAYKLSNIGKLTSIYLAYRNLIKQINIKSNSNDIKTVMRISGGDYEGTPLSIADVNVTNSDEIYNFSYYKSSMSQELQDKLDSYESEYNSRLVNYIQAVNTLQTFYSELSGIQNRKPSTEHSMTWSEYGLTALEEEYDYYNEQMAENLDGSDEETRLECYYILEGTNGISNSLRTRRNEFNSKLQEIENQKLICQSYTINLEEYLGNELYDELSTYQHDVNFVDSTYIVTEDTTNEQILQMKLDLLASAKAELSKVCKPSYTMDINSINFTLIPEFRKYAEQLDLGNILTIEYDNDITVESRLLKMHLNWDNPSDFKLSFCSKNRLEDGWSELAEVQAQVSMAATTQAINGSGWNLAKNKVSTVSQYMTSALNTSLQKLKNGKNEEFLIDSTGTKWRKYLDDSDEYSPNQMWGTGNGLFLTKSGWADLSIAIGEIDLGDGTTEYGIAAPLLVSDLMISSKLKILNEDSSIVLDEAGAKFQNCDIKIVKANNTLLLNAVDGIKMLKGSTPQFYFDANGNATFAGVINGGSMNINNKFIVDSQGNMTSNNMTANNATINNGVFSGKLISPEMNGGVIKGSTFITNQSSIGYVTTIGNGEITNESGYQRVKIAGSGCTFSDNLSNQVNVNPLGITISGASSFVSIVPDGITCNKINGYTPITTNNVDGSHTHSTKYLNVDLTGSGNLDFAGSVNAASVDYVQDNFEPKTSSDIRLKKEIKSIDSSIESFFYNLKPKSYVFKTDKDEKICFGIIAQELESNLEKSGLGLNYAISDTMAVRPYTEDGLYVDDVIHRVDYNQLITLNTYIIQQHKKEIDELKIIVNEQSKQIKELHDKLNNVA